MLESALIIVQYPSISRQKNLIEHPKSLQLRCSRNGWFHERWSAHVLVRRRSRSGGRGGHGRLVVTVAVVVVVLRGGDLACAQWGRGCNYAEPWIA
jgi:hypothetical protein